LVVNYTLIVTLLFFYPTLISIYMATTSNVSWSKTLVPELEIENFSYNVGLLLVLHVFVNISFILNFDIFGYLVYKCDLLFEIHTNSSFNIPCDVFCIFLCAFSVNGSFYMLILFQISFSIGKFNQCKSSNLVFL